MSIEPEMKVGRIAAEYPLATRVFARHGIDFCCGGGRPIATVCEERGIDIDAVLDEIRSVVEEAPADTENWSQVAPGVLIDHILAAYHRPLDEELPRLGTMAEKVLEVHGEKDPERLGKIVSVYRGLRSELEQHMRKEEEILFPMIRDGAGLMAEGPIAVMEEEHENAGAALARLRELTDDYTVPAAACNTWRALWHGLEALERSLMEHIHLENNILFPGALTR